MKKSIIIIFICLFFLVILVGFIHYNAITLKGNICSLIEESDSQRETLYSALFLESYGEFSNIIYYSTFFVLVFSFIAMKMLKLRYKLLFIPLITLAFMFSELLFYKYYFCITGGGNSFIKCCM